MAVSMTRNIPASSQAALAMLAGISAGGALLLDVPIKWKLTFILALGYIGFLFIARNTRRVLLFTMAFAVPLYIGKDFVSHPEHVGLVNVVGINITDVLVVTLLMLNLGRMAIGQTRFRFFPSTTLPALVWLAASGFTLLSARNAEFAGIHLITMSKLFICYLVVANSVEDGEDIRWIIHGLLSGLLFQGLLGAYQGITGEPLGLSTLGETKNVERMLVGQTLAFRSRGTVGHSNCYAMYLVTGIPFALACLFARLKSRWKILAGMVFCAGTLGLLLSLSRGGWLGFLLVLVTVSLFYVGRFRFSGRGMMPVAVLAVLLVLTLVLVGTDLISSRLVSNDHGSALSRITMAKGAIAIIKDYPLTGVGLNNYTLYVSSYDWATYLEHGGVMVVHNIFLLIAAETGLFGVFAFAWFLMSVLVRAWRCARNAPNDILWIAGVGTFSAYLTFAVHGMVDFALLWDMTLFTQFWLLAGLVVGIGGSLCKNGDTRRSGRRPETLKVQECFD